MTMTKRDASEQEFSDLLDKAMEEHGPAKTDAISLPAMLGDYQPLSDLLKRDCGPLYYRKPRLKQRIQIMREYEDKGDVDHASDYIEILCNALSFCIVNRTHDGFQSLTGDDLQDVLVDVDEAQVLGRDILGMDFEKKGSSESEPITENSSAD